MHGPPDRLTQIWVKQHFVEVKRILRLLIAREPLGVLDQDQAADTRSRWIRIGNRYDGRTDAGVTGDGVMHYGCNGITSRLQRRLFVKKNIPPAGRWQFVQSRAEQILIAQLAHDALRLILDDCDDREVRREGFLLIIRQEAD